MVVHCPTLHSLLYAPLRSCPRSIVLDLNTQNKQKKLFLRNKIHCHSYTVFSLAISRFGKDLRWTDWLGLGLGFEFDAVHYIPQIHLSCGNQGGFDQPFFRNETGLVRAQGNHDDNTRDLCCEREKRWDPQSS